MRIPRKHQRKIKDLPYQLECWVTCVSILKHCPKPDGRWRDASCHCAQGFSVCDQNFDTQYGQSSRELEYCGYWHLFCGRFIPLLEGKKENKFSLCTRYHEHLFPQQVSWTAFFILQQHTRTVGVRLQHEVISYWWEGLSRMGNSLPVKKAVHSTLSFNLAEQLLAFFFRGEHVPWTKTVYNH